ncbi:hypothetical protein CWB96_05475 [Pseudoalteromonas citrea]|uniref:Uncharacterized protein n=1 Tax=Pseudoalteromonas citrea TaxID=43655 RepID=A0A5S3XSI9_9GAMM|nr:hypothetical protein CWB97_10480 [Pseudoalteromonas citrea]TMP61074.1 hypothetical protein CWB96_05475 [Pseudoalteromonas citrea]
MLVELLFIYIMRYSTFDCIFWLIFTMLGLVIYQRGSADNTHSIAVQESKGIQFQFTLVLTGSQGIV